MSLPAILYQGSVKNVRGIKGKGPYVFEFSDRYSIFDWGQMPDNLVHKGEALAFMAWFFFEYLGDPKNWATWNAPVAFAESQTLRRLKADGMSHHAIGLVSHDLRTLSLDRQIISPSCCLAVQPVQVIVPESKSVDKKLTWDYTPYKAKPENALVPLEVIFRFGVPEGSSLLKRTSEAAYCKEIGLAVAPKTGDTFALPVIEFSTKLETSDRYISYAEAQEIAGLSDTEFTVLKDMAALAALRLKDCFGEINVELWDGKFEFAFTAQDAQGDRGFMLVDSIGPDELRLLCDGVHLSKEILRLFYRPTAWHSAIEKSKDLAKTRGEKDWKRICTEELKSVPPMLSPAVKQKVEMVYKGLCKALSQKVYGRAVFPDAWPLDEVVKSFAPKTGREVA
jgi:phosphoribosylaminoimidazole-succinocarboxamide synthase